MHRELFSPNDPDLMVSQSWNNFEPPSSENARSRNIERLRRRSSEASSETLVALLSDVRSLVQELRADASRLEDVHSEMRRHAILMGLWQTAMTAYRSRNTPPRESVRQPKQILGLDTFASETNFLPTVKIHKTDRERNPLGCLICLEEYSNNIPIFVLACHESHNFHPSCFLHWAKRQFSCPICFSSFEPDR